MYECCKCFLSINNRKERVFMLGRKYHKKCFCCDICNVSLTHYANEVANGLYCHNCSFKLNGPTKAAYFMAKWKINRMKKNNIDFPDN